MSEKFRLIVRFEVVSWLSVVSDVYAVATLGLHSVLIIGEILRFQKVATAR